MKQLLGKLRSDGAPWGLVTELSTLSMSLFTFIVVGDRLGPSLFGALAAVLATIAIAGPLVVASPEHVIVQRIAQGVPVGRAWARAAAVLVFVGPLLGVLMIGAAAIIAPSMSALAVFLISIGEVVLLGLARVAIRAHEAVGDSSRGSRVAIVNLATRAVALVGFLLIDDPSLEAWTALHVGASLLAALHAHWSLRAHREPQASFSLPSVDDYRLGVPFALTAGPDELLAGNDKMVLSGAGLDTDAGIYAAAYRIASIAGVPARSVVRTRYASYFRDENQSPESSIANARSIMRTTAPAGLMSGLLLVVIAPVTQFILGDDFSESVDALRFLAFLPIVRAVSTPCANVLTGTGRQRLRIIGTLGAGVLNLCLNLALIPSYGWQAAAATTLVAEFVLLAWVIYHVFRPTRTREPAVVR